MVIKNMALIFPSKLTVGEQPKACDDRSKTMAFKLLECVEDWWPTDIVEHLTLIECLLSPKQADIKKLKQAVDAISALKVLGNKKPSTAMHIFASSRFAKLAIKESTAIVEKSALDGVTQKEFDNVIREIRVMEPEAPLQDIKANVSKLQNCFAAVTDTEKVRILVNEADQNIRKWMKASLERSFAKWSEA